MTTKYNPLHSGAFLLRQVAEKRLTADELTKHQKKLCAIYLIHEEKHTQIQIAEILHVHRNTVHDWVKRFKSQAARMFDGEIDQRTVAVELKQLASIAISSLMRDNKYKDAWTVKKELIESLQTLGFIPKEPIRLEGSLRLSLREVIELAIGSGKAADIAADDSGKNGSQEISPSHQNGNGSISNRSHPSLEGP